MAEAFAISLPFSTKGTSMEIALSDPIELGLNAPTKVPKPMEPALLLYPLAERDDD